MYREESKQESDDANRTSSIELSPGIEIGANIESKPVVFHESWFVAVSYGGNLGLIKLTKDWKSDDSTIHGLIYCENQIIPLSLFKCSRMKPYLCHLIKDHIWGSKASSSHKTVNKLVNILGSNLFTAPPVRDSRKMNL